MYKFLCCVVALALTGCASSRYYAEPKLGADGVATISSYESKMGMGNWDESRVVAIDNKYVTAYNAENLFGYSIKDKKVALRAGPHQLYILTTLNRNFLSGDFEAYTLVNLNVLPGRRYQINEDLDGNQVKIWITDQYNVLVVPALLEPFHPRASRTSYVPALVK